jgi:hypothetical protein
VGRVDSNTPGVALAYVLRVLSFLSFEIGEEERCDCFFEGFNAAVLS